MNILQAMQKLNKEQWEAISEVIDYNGDPSVLEWILKELKNNKDWNIEYDFFNNNDPKWFLVSSDRSFVIATNETVDPLKDLATQYGKSFYLDESNHPDYNK